MLSGMARIAIIGGGSIGEAMLSGLLRAGRQVKDLVVAERMPDRAKYLSSTYGVLVVTSVKRCSGKCDVRRGRGQAGRRRGGHRRSCRRGRRRLSSDSAEQVFVTVAAGLTITYFESKLPAGTPVVRAMPNAAALVGAGVTALAKGRFVTPAAAG